MKYIKLTQGKFALVDDEDFVVLNKFSWSVHIMGYAQSKLGETKNNLVLLHRFILNPLKGQQIDHINHNKLDNRRGNLRIVNPSQNAANRNKKGGQSSKFKGVYWSKRFKNWRAQITKDYKTKNLGSYLTQKEAAKAYNIAAKELFGEYAKLNLFKRNQTCGNSK